MDSDQQWYTLHEFQDYYGIDRAARWWKQARREQAKVDVAKAPPPQPQVSNASAAQPARLPPPQPQSCPTEERGMASDARAVQPVRVEPLQEGQCTQFCALWWHPPCWGVGPCRCFRPADHPNTVLCACRHCMRPADDPGARWKRFVRRYSALVRMRRQHDNSGFVLRRFLAMRLYPDKRELWPEH